MPDTSHIETPDFGQTWRSADGRDMMLPLTEVDNPALVHDYQSEGLSVNVYLKDIRFDKNGWAWKTDRRQIKQ